MIKKISSIDKLMLKKLRLLQRKAIKEGKILSFSDNEFDKLREIYHGNFPALIYIKYLRPLAPVQIGQCFERSLVISSIFDDAKLVRGNRKDYEISYGKGSWHWWVEHDGWCYDPATLLKTKKEIYYKLYKPKELIEMSKEEILEHGYYKEMVGYAPKASMLISGLIALDSFLSITNDEEFKKEIKLFEKKINYTDANSYDIKIVYETIENMKKVYKKDGTKGDL